MWVTGSHLGNQGSVHSGQGIFHVDNTPSARYECTSWIDNGGHLWMFGGSGLGDGYRGDLWCFNVTLNAWAWISGNDTDNYPGSFGVYRVYDTSNSPPARRTCSSWIDNDQLFYIFGGQLTGSTYGNDVWCYNQTLNQWAWIGGSNVTNDNGVYGYKGVEDSSNHPGCRTTVASWMSNDYVYIFGGWGRSWSGATGYLNDLWRYNISTDLWAWMSGENYTNSPGSYGTKGIFSTTNEPSSRRHGVSCVDINTNLYLFGGYSPMSGGGLMNDLWRYDVIIHDWAWISGNETVNVHGNYGTQGIINSSNYIGARQRTSIHCDSNGYIWIFGGNGLDSIGDTGHLNDLWIYIPDDIVIISEYIKLQNILPFILGTLTIIFVLKRKRRKN
jgi:hypothetical protein